MLACVQLAFTLSWTVYVVYLPAMLARAGLAGLAPWVLAADQLVFALTDLYVGARLDDASLALARAGRALAGLVLVSALAFALVPVAVGKAALLVAVFVWVVASSALRVPPLVLLSKHAGPRAGTRAATAYAFGIGVAGALAPYLQLVLRDRSPTLPFVLSSGGVVVATLALVPVLRASNATPASDERGSKNASPLSATARTLLAAVGLGAVAFQAHFALRAAPGFTRLAGPDALAKLMPVFWVGFNLAIVPVTLLLAKRPARTVLVAAGALGALTASVFEGTGSLAVAIACQLVAGGAWAALFFAGLGGAATLGATGREGKLVGRFFALLSGAAVLRLAFVGAGLDKKAASLLPAVPPLAWAAVAIALLLGDLHDLDRRTARAEH